MTTSNIIPNRHNKHSHYNDKDISQKVDQLVDQITCLQKSFAELRKDLCVSILETTRNKDRSFWIHR
jgi:hypothetical protein